MADPHKALKITSAFEGGLTMHPDDNGNWTGGQKGVGKLIGTKYGIAAPTLCTYLGRTATAEEMKNLSRETADLIIIKNYWIPIKGDEIERQWEAQALFDMAVNKGVKKAVELMQESLGVPVTGKMNKQTLDKLNNK